MSSDGAHLGVSAKRALDTILGGRPEPAEAEQEDAASVRARILAATQRGGAPASYEDCADMVAGMVLMFYDAHPEALGWPVEAAHHWERDGKTVDPAESGWDNLTVVNDGPDLYGDVNAFTEGKLSDLGITGFQWGWAVNAARFTKSLPPEPNPALIEVRSP
jgi:hypothetical protein